MLLSAIAASLGTSVFAPASTTMVAAGTGAGMPASVLLIGLLGSLESMVAAVGLARGEAESGLLRRPAPHTRRR